MRLGAHISTAGGLFRAFGRAEEVGCDTMLIFTKSNRQWQAKPLTAEDIAQYKETAAASPIRPVAVHASYLINVASPDEALWEKSYQALKIELLRADVLDIPFLTFHPGSHVGSGEAAGLAQIARALRRLIDETPDCQTTLCLETMAGQGTNIGSRFEHLAHLLAHGDPGRAAHRLGVCFDTCHVFSAGYDIRTPDTYAATMAEFDQVIGLDRLQCFHFNDSKHPLGDGKDRHEHIGQGHIGRAGFANFVNDPRWANHAAHLETPKTEKDDNGQEIEMDAVNLATLRALRHSTPAG